MKYYLTSFPGCFFLVIFVSFVVYTMAIMYLVPRLCLISRLSQAAKEFVFTDAKK